MVTIRSATLADAESIAQVHVDSWRTTYAGTIPTAYLDNLSVSARAAQWRRTIEAEDERIFLFVAHEERTDAPPRIVGFAAGGPERAGDAIYTCEFWRLQLCNFPCITAPLRHSLQIAQFVLGLWGR